MKILFLANRFPYPPFRGDKLKIYHLAKRLSKQHEVHLITFLEDEADNQYLPELQSVFTSIHLVPLSKFHIAISLFKGIFSKQPFQVAYFKSKKMEENLKVVLQEIRPDIVHVQHLRMAPYMAADQQFAKVLDLPDAYSLYWNRRVAAHSGIKKILNRIEYRRTVNYESVLNQYPLTLVCSKEDQAYLQEKQGIAHVSLLPNGVDLSNFSNEKHDYGQSDFLLFTGNMDYAPNIDAVIYFTQDVLPLIRKRCPRVKFIIAGQRPVQKVLNLANEFIEITGFVPNLAEMYAKASVVVAPLRFGAGTQNKVLEAMAMGVPVVSRNIGFNGLNIQSGEGVILSTETIDFAQQCVDLLNSEHKRMEVGEKGKKVIKHQFDWEVITAQLENYFKITIENKKHSHAK